ncbi:MAG TPA: diguanylate cyclase [Candidatus Scatovivens faecipullorum]|nr:diguanylate cyclase [Candidatus Scatovivens faecipullorum]
MVIVVIIILLIAIIVLVAYNFHIQKKIEAYNNINQKISNLSVLQDFMKVAGEEDSVDAKLNKINEIVIEKYDIKYSTIVVFDGAEYVIKATNVDKIHHETLTNLHTEEIFQDSVATATPKYITIDNENEKLPYQKVEMGRAKSAMFFPLYIDNIYIGYWIMESGRMHAFDKTDTTIIEVVKDNIISILSTMSYQDAMENIIRVDKFTGLYSAEYLYSKAKKTFDKYPTSAVCMFKIINIEEIYEKASRQIGNEIITEISNIVKSKMPAQYVFVRYMGPKFVIVFSGVEEGSVEEFLKELKKEMEELEIVEEAEEIPVVKVINGKKMKVRELKEEKSASPKINFVVSTYYKGTGIEQLNKKLEEYIDSADKNESQINYI